MDPDVLWSFLCAPGGSSERPRFTDQPVEDDRYGSAPAFQPRATSSSIMTAKPSIVAIVPQNPQGH